MQSISGTLSTTCVYELSEVEIQQEYQTSKLKLSLNSLEHRILKAAITLKYKLILGRLWIICNPHSFFLTHSHNHIPSQTAYTQHQIN